MLDRIRMRIRKRLLDRMVLRPSRHRIPAQHQHRVLLESSGKPLECFVQRNFDDGERADVLIVKFPGTGGRAERSTSFPAELLPPTRAEVWTWNPPGYGDSVGRASLDRIAEAAVDFWDQLAQRCPFDQIPTLLCGNSLGCVTALHVAASRCNELDHCGMLLRNPPPLIPVVKRIASRYPLRRVTDRIAESLGDSMNAQRSAPQVTLPAIFLQSELDTLVPPVFQQLVVDAFAGPKQVVMLEGLTHEGIPGDEHEPAIRAALDWLWKKVSKPT